MCDQKGVSVQVRSFGRAMDALETLPPAFAHNPDEPKACDEGAESAHGTANADPATTDVSDAWHSPQTPSTAPLPTQPTEAELQEQLQKRLAAMFLASPRVPSTREVGALPPSLAGDHLVVVSVLHRAAGS